MAYRIGDGELVQISTAVGMWTARVTLFAKAFADTQSQPDCALNQLILSAHLFVRSGWVGCGATTNDMGFPLKFLGVLGRFLGKRQCRCMKHNAFVASQMPK